MNEYHYPIEIALMIVAQKFRYYQTVMGIMGGIMRRAAAFYT